MKNIIDTFSTLDSHRLHSLQKKSISILYSLAFFMEIYSNDKAMNFGSFENAAIITAVSLSLFFASVIITTVMINRKMKNLDVIKTLKDYFY